MVLSEKLLFFLFFCVWIFASIVPGPVTIRFTIEAHGSFVGAIVAIVWMVLMMSGFFAAWRLSRYLAVNCGQNWRGR
jgi:hypothetical protein